MGRTVFRTYLQRFALILCSALFLSGCVRLGESSELPLLPQEPTPQPVDRIACQEIFGTAFRSESERQWFQQNCSTWPPVAVADEPIRSTSSSAEPAECAAMRGRPYESNEQRTWFLQNCSGNRAAAAVSPGEAAERRDCDAIRGTPYRSNAERTWYMQNCSTAQTQVTSGPDRTDCAAIRGTAYRSAAEREWFLSNCR